MNDSMNPMLLEFAGRTHIGLVRQRNEDALLLCPEQALFVVADGMGGHLDGHIASHTTVQAIEQFFKIASLETCNNWPVIATHVSDPHACRLVSAIEYAHREVVRKGRNGDPSMGIMGSTVVALHFAGSLAFIAHVGDSRCYRLRRGVFSLLTQDHVQYVSPQGLDDEGIPQGDRRRSYHCVLSRAIGGGEDECSITVDIYATPVQPGDLYLLSSDGLHGQTDRISMQQVLVNEENVDAMCEQLVNLALNGGGLDNISALAVRYVTGPTDFEVSRWSEDTEPVSDPDRLPFILD